MRGTGENYFVCNFSGGKDSTAMLLLMIELSEYTVSRLNVI